LIEITIKHRYDTAFEANAAIFSGSFRYLIVASFQATDKRHTHLSIIDRRFEVVLKFTTTLNLKAQILLDRFFLGFRFWFFLL